VQGGNTIETYRFAGDNVDVQSNSGDAVIQLCIVARGFSEPRCNSMNSAIQVAFVTEGSADTVTISAMGRLSW
jgi:hypothetical protein